MIIDGGQAFPGDMDTKYDFYHHGMSLRDYFAGQALMAILPLCTEDTREDGESYEDYASKVSYSVADAMLKTRKKG